MNVPVNRNAIGTVVPETSLVADAGRLRFFAKATGETNPIYFDRAAARDAGYRDLPVPPTFLFGIELEAHDPFEWLSALGVDLRRVLHGEQSFDYDSIAHAGDKLIARPRISDVFSKRGGALDFIVKETAVTREDESPVATLISTIVVQNPEVSQ